MVHFSSASLPRKEAVFFHCTNQASVLLSGMRPDADNETREQRRRRRVGKVLVPHSAARD